MLDPTRGLVANLDAFHAEHREATRQEGWGLWLKLDGPSLCIERIDDPNETPNHLSNDAVAWAIVVNGTEPHHVAALQLLTHYNPAEAISIASHKELRYEH